MSDSRRIYAPVEVRETGTWHLLGFIGGDIDCPGRYVEFVASKPQPIPPLTSMVVPSDLTYRTVAMHIETSRAGRNLRYPCLSVSWRDTHLLNLVSLFKPTDIPDDPFETPNWTVAAAKDTP